MPVPLLDAAAQNLALEREFIATFDRVFRSGQYILGPDLAEFERELARAAQVKHALAVSSGTDAILLALMALEIQPGDEVLCPSFTFFATAGCVSRIGAVPVFVDSDPVTFNIELNDAARKVSPRTRAIIPVHLFGQCADMDAVMAFASELQLHVIEDAAQAFGAKWRGQPAGSMGTFGTYSFFPSKNLGAVGDAGALVCQDDTLAEKARVLRNHGAQPKYFHKYIGGNFRMDTLQAAFLSVKLPSLPGYNERRRANAAFYSERLPKELILPAALPHNDHIWNQFTIRVPGEGRRDALRAHLQQRQIGCEIYYPVPLDRQECFAHLPSAGSCPVAEALSREVLSIPIFPELTPEQRDEVVSTITEFFR